MTVVSHHKGEKPAAELRGKRHLSYRNQQLDLLPLLQDSTEENPKYPREHRNQQRQNLKAKLVLISKLLSEKCSHNVCLT